jgi:putative ABC transport system ATP-binding protein
VPPVIETHDLRVTLRDRERTFRLDASGLDVTPGQSVGLTGPSGTGKTLLLELIGLLRRPDPGGRYMLRPGAGDAVDVTRLWSGNGGALSAFRGSEFGFIPQNGGLLPFLTLRENIALCQEISGRPDPAHAAALADRLGITALLGLRPDRLSIGQRQRGVIAAALAHRPAVVIADEPTAALDPDNAAEALTLILEAAGQGGSAVLISSHDLDLLARFELSRYVLRLAPDSRSEDVLSQLHMAPVQVPA